MEESFLERIAKNSSGKESRKRVAILRKSRTLFRFLLSVNCGREVLPIGVS